MALSAQEFAASLDKLGPYRLSTSGDAVFDLAEGSVAIAFTPQPAKTLGGLLSLPQAIVALEFDNVGAHDRDAFIRRFDVAFQRGGG